MHSVIPPKKKLTTELSSLLPPCDQFRGQSDTKEITHASYSTPAIHRCTRARLAWSLRCKRENGKCETGKSGTRLRCGKCGTMENEGHDGVWNTVYCLCLLIRAAIIEYV